MQTRRVLVADNYPDAAEVLMLLFDALGCVTRAATSGAEALAILEQYEADIIMLDVDLGDMNGLDVGRAIRARCDRGVYLIAVTGNSDAMMETQAMVAGFDRFMLKPLGLADLRELMISANDPRVDRTPTRREPPR